MCGLSAWMHGVWSPAGPQELAACMPNLARPSPTSESARCECREGSPGCRPDSGYVVVLEDNHRAERLVDLVAGDHLGCHLAYSPCIVVGGSDDGSCSSPIPGMQQAAGGPHPGPVAVLRSRTAGEHVLGWRSAQRQDQVIVNLAAFQQVDASGDHSWLPPTCALGLDALAWRHPGPAHHDQSVAPVNPDLLPVRHARTVGNHRWPAWLPLSRSVQSGLSSDLVVVSLGGQRSSYGRAGQITRLWAASGFGSCCAEQYEDHHRANGHEADGFRERTPVWCRCHKLGTRGGSSAHQARRPPRQSPSRQHATAIVVTRRYGHSRSRLAAAIRGGPPTRAAAEPQ